MNSSLQEVEGNKVKLSITIDESEFDREIDRAFRKIAKEVRLPGFRAGKAPRRVLEARIGLAPAREQALNDAIPQYLAKAVREHEVDVIDTPDVEITSGREEGPVAFDATLEVRPEVTVPGYDGLRVELSAVAVTDEEVDSEVAAELKRFGTLDDIERPAAVGDYVVVDLAGTRDGEPVPGLNADDWSYEIGQGWVSDDFDDHLVGVTPGDERSFATTPKGTTEPVDMTIKVSRVQQLVAPELTDDWVGENIGEFDTVAAWTESVRRRLGETKLQSSRNELIGRTTAELVKLTDIEPPQPLVNSDLRRRVEGTARQLAARGIDLEQFLSATGQDGNSFVEGLRPESEQAVRLDLALRAVAAAEGLDADDDELRAEYQRIAMQTGQKLARVRSTYEDAGVDVEIRAQIRKSKALDWLLHHVDFVDPAGNDLDRDELLGHDHDHDHDDDDHDDAEHGATPRDDSDHDDNSPTPEATS
ncbi:MAG TPA: trigger factor [Desertimonas sp.]|nr:trigger factor [Desertimonas sp.]